jgi:hypothetical protein
VFEPSREQLGSIEEANITTASNDLRIARAGEKHAKFERVGALLQRAALLSGSNSVVESQPSKLLVAGPIPVSRSKINNLQTP